MRLVVGFGLPEATVVAPGDPGTPNRKPNKFSALKPGWVTTLAVTHAVGLRSTWAGSSSEKV